MSKSLIKANAYDELIDSLHITFRDGLLAVKKLLEYQRLKTYWGIGEKVGVYIEAFAGSISSKEEFYSQLSRDFKERTGLELEYDTIRRTVQFYREYPKFPKGTPLTFSHYLALMRVHDARLRLRLEKKAVKKGMTVPDLRDEISQIALTSDHGALEQKDPMKLKVERGEPFVYRVKRQKDINGNAVFFIDCGFKIFKSMPSGNEGAHTDNRIVRVVKVDNGYRLRMCEKARCMRYTYLAVPGRVVDGDTFDACVNVGFGIWIKDRFRLRGINAPELKSPGGRRAKVFLTRCLSKCPGIIIRTTKEGVYGRWLADVFILKGKGKPKGTPDPYKIAKEGEYLNQTMLDRGLAEVYRK